MSAGEAGVEAGYAFEALTDILNRLGQVADALCIAGDRDVALAFASDSRLSWDYRRGVARLAEGFAACDQTTEALTFSVLKPDPRCPPADVEGGWGSTPDEEQRDWERIISRGTAGKRGGRTLDRDAKTVLESGLHLLEANRPGEALRCGVWLRWVQTTNAGRESASKLIRGGLVAIRKQTPGRLLSVVQDVWETHAHDKPIRDLAFACLTGWMHMALATTNPGKRFRGEGVTPAYVRDVSRWVASRPGVTEASVAQARLAVVCALDGYRTHDPVHTMEVVRELLQELKTDDFTPKIAQQGIRTLPLLARVAPQLAAVVVQEDWLWSKARVPTKEALIETLGILAGTAPAGVDMLARRLWNRHAGCQEAVEGHYRSAMRRRTNPQDVVAAYGQSPACSRLDEIAADVVWETAMTAAKARQIPRVAEVVRAVAQRAEVCPRIVFDVFGHKPSDATGIHFHQPLGRMNVLLQKLEGC